MNDEEDFDVSSFPPASLHTCVRVVKATNPGAWYRDYIGEIFKVGETHPSNLSHAFGAYSVEDPKNTHGTRPTLLIREEDCEIVPDVSSALDANDLRKIDPHLDL